MPLTLIVLKKIWEIFESEKGEKEERGKGEDVKRENNVEADEKSFSPFHLFPFSTFLIGLLAGTLPLIHLHSLLVLFFVGVFVLIVKPESWREWIAFGVGVAIIAIPELAWAMTGSATNAREFIAYHFGWETGEMNFFWFWLKNTGILFLILIFGIYLAFVRKEFAPETKKKSEPSILGEKHLNFYLPFFFCFAVSNLTKLAPWPWDNIKVLIYWFIGSLPFVAVGLVWLFNRDKLLKIVAIGCFVILILSGALDVWRVVSRQINYNVFNADGVRVAERIKEKTEPDALFANAPTYNSPVVLSGRRSMMRYVGHLASYGIDFKDREDDLKRIYAGDATAEILMRKYGVDYIIVTPEEKRWTNVNEEYLKKFRLIAQSGENKVYKIGN